MDINNQNIREANVARRLKNLVKAGQSLADIESLESLLPKLLKLAQEVTDAEAFLVQAAAGMVRFTSSMRWRKVIA